MLDNHIVTRNNSYELIIYRIPQLNGDSIDTAEFLGVSRYLIRTTHFKMFSKLFLGKQERTIHPNNNYPQVEKDYKFRGMLRSQSYYPLDIGNVLYSYRSRENVLSTLTEEELAIVKSPIATNTDVPQRKKMLMDWFIIFDKMFFFDNLQKEINSIEFEAQKRMKQLDAAGFYDPAENRIFINLQAEMTLELTYTLTLTHQSYEEYLICILLHEMTHAFIRRYSCRCQPCLKIRQSVHLGGDGPHGHGPLWADAMTGIQTAFQNVVKWKVYCCIDFGVRDEMKVSKWKASPTQLSRWGLLRTEPPSGATYSELRSQKANGHWLEGQEEGFYPDIRENAPLLSAAHKLPGSSTRQLSYKGPVLLSTQRTSRIRRTVDG
jgi:hypothetical protein